jgi:hypothetical protein
MKQAYLQMGAPNYERFKASINQLEDLGAKIRHRVYPYAAIGQIESGSEALIGTIPGVRQLFVGKIEEVELATLAGREIMLAKAYNKVFFSTMTPPRSADFAAGDPLPLDLPPLEIPQEYLDEIKEARRNAPEGPMPFPEATSEFLLGHVAVGAILPESVPGTGSHNWTTHEEQTTTEKILSAFDWWARHSPNQELRFSYEINYEVPVTVEPMEDGQNTIEDVWAGQSLAHLGYTEGNYFAQCYDYINEMRGRYDADWGFVCFVLHGFPGQRFDMGALAYAYLGGPLNVNVYSVGAYGPGILDRVIAHESGHTFYTLDEYPSAMVTCSSRSGYLNAENANKQRGGNACVSNVPCVMRGGSQSTPFNILDPCYYTCGQVGWWDEDADGIPDPLDTEPEVNWVALDSEPYAGAPSIDTVRADRATFTGSVSSVPYVNRNERSMFHGVGFTVEPVSAEYRVDGGPWTPCEPLDGRFDDTTERYSFTVRGLAPWHTYNIEVRAVTAHGNVTPDDKLAAVEVYSDQEPPIVLINSSNPTQAPVSISFTPYHSSREAGASVRVEIAIYDVMGRKIKSVENGDFATGAYYEANWDGTDSNGGAVPAGVYFVGMLSQGRMTAEKLLVIP